MLKVQASSIFLGIIVASCAITPARKENITTAQDASRRYMSGTKLVMVTHPLCGFSDRAFKDFTPEINEYFAKNAVFIAPVADSSLEQELDSIEVWNKNSAFEHLAVLDTSNIAALDLKETPQFYFFQDGVLLEKIVGWPKDKSNLSKLENAIHRHQSKAIR